MSIVVPNVDNFPALKYKYRQQELVLLSNWRNVLTCNKSMYHDASKYYARIHNVISIFSGSVKGVAGATVLTALLTDSLGIPQYVVTMFTIIFIVVSILMSAATDIMQFKSKSMLYKGTSKHCDSLLKEIEMQCALEYQNVDFACYAKMVKYWMDIIVASAPELPERVVKQNTANYEYNDIIVQIVKNNLVK
jgi:hypothetical protein